MNAITGMVATSEMTGGEALVRMLLAFDTALLFGTGDFPFSDVSEAAERLGLRRHSLGSKRNAIAAADAYARVSGKAGIVCVADGADADSALFGGSADARPKAPVVIITGSGRPERFLPANDQTVFAGAGAPLNCKKVLHAGRSADIPGTLKRAISLATSGRPGPVMVRLTDAVLKGIHSFSSREFSVNRSAGLLPSSRCRPCDLALKEAATYLSFAKRPVILCGGGVHLSGAADEIALFATLFNIPVAHTPNGKGAVACTSKLNAGLFGQAGRIANGLLEEADCILAVGCDAADPAAATASGGRHGATVIHLDIVAEGIDGAADPAIRLWGDARLGLEDLRVQMLSIDRHQDENRARYVSEVMTRMTRWRTKNANMLYSADAPVRIPRLITALRRALPADGLVLADDSMACWWTALVLDSKQTGRCLLADCSRGSSSLSGAIGAKLAAPHTDVAAVTGVSGFLSAFGELENAARSGLGFAVIVANPAVGQDGVTGSGHESADIATIANDMGCVGVTVETPADLDHAFGLAMDTPEQPVVIDVRVAQEMPNNGDG